MNLSVSSAVTNALPILAESAPSIDLREVQSDLEAVARDALEARERGISLLDAVVCPDFPDLKAFHSGIRDALFLEIPPELDPWVHSVTDGGKDNGVALSGLQRMIVDFAQGEQGSDDPQLQAMQQILAELLVFEALRLQLLVMALGNGEYEQLGGEESDIDAIAWAEVQALLHEPELRDPAIRPLQVLRATASVSLARDAALRAEELRRAGPDLRDEVRMRARLRAALRELRLPEAVLLENALANLLGSERHELGDLQNARPLALEGLSRQAMDQRVSRGRRALTRPKNKWPRRRRPALFDLLSTANDRI
ncbi:MAG TPA: hypothetical protein ENK31_00295 [Nannocystis exedens]|nr:hypothetical protein [Nannocystis exedens]